MWISRDAEAKDGPKAYDLTREIIKVKSVEFRALDNGIGYVRLKQFQQSSAEELGLALEEIRARAPIRGVVLDLRGNPGGLLDQAAKIADRPSSGYIPAWEARPWNRAAIAFCVGAPRMISPIGAAWS